MVTHLLHACYMLIVLIATTHVTLSVTMVTHLLHACYMLVVDRHNARYIECNHAGYTLATCRLHAHHNACYIACNNVCYTLTTGVLHASLFVATHVTLSATLHVTH